MTSHFILYKNRFSGYDGAIKCLVENGGDVAFTKVIYVRKYFGVSGAQQTVLVQTFFITFSTSILFFISSQLPIGHATESLTEAQASPNDYEYLCEDGTKVPITERACTWAQRPWQAYMGNGDITNKVELIKVKRILYFCHRECHKHNSRKNILFHFFPSSFFI